MVKTVIERLVSVAFFVLQSTLSCLWCSQPDFMSDHLQGFLIARIPCSSSPYREAYSDLLNCSDCINVFHYIVSKYNEDSQLAYNHVTSRIVASLNGWLEGEKDDDINCCILIREILTYPRLMLESDINSALVSCLRWFLENDGNYEIPKDEKLPGLYLLLVHPSDTVSIVFVYFCIPLGIIRSASGLVEQLDHLVSWIGLAMKILKKLLIG